LLAFLLAAAPSYYESIRAWQNDRDARLRSPDGWLTLVGLFWLKPGENSVGSDPSNNIVLPKPVPARFGVIWLKGDRVSFTNTAGKTTPLSYDEDHPDVVRSGTVSFYVIKRGDRFAIRAKDTDSPALKNFKGMQYFPINPELHFLNARFVADARKIPILNIVGQTENEDSPGYVEFSYRGQTFRLRPIYEGDTLFFLFKDPTNKTQTYPAGRMLNTPLPKDGKVDLDFNRAYNPPCTFTPYATCPLPPKENMLSFPVEAGELRYLHP
jgi:uncharacterized protein (DUF1684 family)